MRVVGFGHKAQVGKDTAANYLEGHTARRVKRVAFADKLKRIAMDLFGLSYEQCYGPPEIKEAVDPRYGKSPRQIMQELGEKMREIHEHIWVDTVFNATIPPLQKRGYDYFAISDVRYPNEGDRIHHFQGVVVRVDRDAGGSSVGADHSSETAMEDYEEWDFIIENNGTFEEYYAKVDDLMEEIDGREKGQDHH
jgi:hypothetical protein